MEQKAPSVKVFYCVPGFTLVVGDKYVSCMCYRGFHVFLIGKSFAMTKRVKAIYDYEAISKLSKIIKMFLIYKNYIL